MVFRRKYRTRLRRRFTRRHRRSTVRRSTMFRRRFFRRRTTRTFAKRKYWGRGAYRTPTTGNSHLYNNSLENQFNFHNTATAVTTFQNMDNVPKIDYVDIDALADHWIDIMGGDKVQMIRNMYQNGGTYSQNQAVCIDYFKVKIRHTITTWEVKPNTAKTIVTPLSTPTNPVAYWGPNAAVDKWIRASEDYTQVTKWVPAYCKGGEFLYTTTWKNAHGKQSRWTPVNTFDLIGTPAQGGLSVPGGQLAPWSPRFYQLKLRSTATINNSGLQTDKPFIPNVERFLDAQGLSKKNLLRMPSLKLISPGASDGATVFVQVQTLIDFAGNGRMTGNGAWQNF